MLPIPTYDDHSSCISSGHSMNYQSYQSRLLLIFGLLLIGNFNPAQADNLSPPECPIKTLATDFQTIRTIPGHSNNGRWNNDIDGWHGRKHQIMNQIGFCLGTGKYQRSEIIQLLGSPDHIAVKDDPLFYLIQNDSLINKTIPDTNQFLIYQWRGYHDFLYFNAAGDKIVNSGWWFAGE